MNDINNTRRAFLAKTTIISGVAFLGGFGNLALAQGINNAVADASNIDTASSLLGFKELGISTSYTVEVAEGYKAQVLISWGDKIIPGNTADFNQTESNSAADQEAQFGDHNDGMDMFPIDDNKFLLAVNNESTTKEYLYRKNGEVGSSAPTSTEDVEKAQAAVGVSIIEVNRSNNGWVVNKESKLNRRITANTPMTLGGPAANSPRLATGNTVLGTMANCACGKTPWGTYLTCEENFNSYFGYSDKSAVIPDDLNNFGFRTSGSFGWQNFDDRFDLTKNPNEANRFGWVVEIDPYNVNSTPVKRTALGRFKHENAAVHIATTGQVVVYMGDDQANQFVYKFVSKNKFIAGNIENNRNLLDEGTLYVAKFDGTVGENKGTGQWLELTYGKDKLNEANGFSSQADVVINARSAAALLDATPMDRPEWVAINPNNGQVFCTLTNNGGRSVANAPNPRTNNAYGQIVRWTESGNNHTALTFNWDLFVIAGNPNKYPADTTSTDIADTDYLKNGSANITKTNAFNSPDGIGFDKYGRVWILTDGSDSNSGGYSGQGNNSVLVGDPATGEIRRFLTVPKGGEATGLAFTPDGKTVFINVQHPGGRFPGNGTVPRSSVIMVTKNDGEIIAAADSTGSTGSNGNAAVGGGLGSVGSGANVGGVGNGLGQGSGGSLGAESGSANQVGSGVGAPPVRSVPTISTVVAAGAAVGVAGMAINKLRTSKDITNQE